MELHYIGVESAEITKKRVSKRVKQGGHGIPEKILKEDLSIYFVT